MIIYDCLKCCPVVRNLGDGFFLRIFMQHYEYKTLSKCRAFIFCTKKYPRKTGGCSGAGAVAKLVSCCQDLPGYSHTHILGITMNIFVHFLILSHFAFICLLSFRNDFFPRSFCVINNLVSFVS